MPKLPAPIRIFLYVVPIDMHKSFSGLHRFNVESVEKDPRCPEIGSSWSTADAIDSRLWLDNLPGSGPGAISRTPDLASFARDPHRAGLFLPAP